MKTVLLFDPETLHYHRSLYSYFKKEFAGHGYRLKVVYDNRRNDIQGDLYVGIDYSFKNFNAVIKEYNSRLVILFMRLRWYPFLLPFMLYNRLKGIKLIFWSHGINLQRKNRWFMNQLYYIRQMLSHGLIIYSENEKKYIKASHRKLFIANNTLNFHDIPEISLSKEQLKEKYGLAGKKIVLCVGRMNTNNRKVEYLLEGFASPSPGELALVVVGEGVNPELQERMKDMENVHYLGAVYEPVKINEIYKMSDIFCMPGAIGLAVNHSFFHGLPVVVEDVPHGPEIIYFKDGQNGFFFKEGDINDMMAKINILSRDEQLYQEFSRRARESILSEAGVEKMRDGFLEAIRYVERRRPGKN